MYIKMHFAFDPCITFDLPVCDASLMLFTGGNDVILACKTKEKGEDAVQMIKAELPNSLVQFMQVLWVTIEESFSRDCSLVIM